MPHKDMKNAEGYPDPTAYTAIKNVNRESEYRCRKLRDSILSICDVAGFEIQGPLILIEKKSGKTLK